MDLAKGNIDTNIKDQFDNWVKEFMLSENTSERMEALLMAQKVKLEVMVKKAYIGEPCKSEDIFPTDGAIDLMMNVLQMEFKNDYVRVITRAEEIVMRNLINGKPQNNIKELDATIKDILEPKEEEEEK